MQLKIAEQEIQVFSAGTVVIGSGAAGFNAANSLLKSGVRNIAMITENVKWGTSRNTGSDKQTYYKLTLSGDVPDAVREMADTLYNGQCVDGDLALAEAALSVKSFFHLAEIGVPFPRGRYGEYIGYKTDHDPKHRATSAGPLTSKLMTECLEREAAALGLEIHEHQQVIQVLHRDGALGLLCLCEGKYIVWNCKNIVFATGGPAKIYHNVVYPPSQTGASGVAFEAGIKGKNLTEWQYGLASVRPAWNVSGSFMQVLPRFVSTGQDGGDEREFLQDYIRDRGDLLTRIFLKGYQWPFDTRRCAEGSSLIDLLVYQETVLKGRRVFLDFTKNPFDNAPLDFSVLSEEARDYLSNSGILFGTPIERLRHLNLPAYQFYVGRGVDIAKEKLEIALCAQHNNGGMSTDCWWQTNLEGCFSVGEACGSHGVYRPGGSALNAGQVGSTRAAQYISQCRQGAPIEETDFAVLFQDDIAKRIALGQSLYGDSSNIAEVRLEVTKGMDAVGASMRSLEKIESALEQRVKMYREFENMVKIQSDKELGSAYALYDILIAQIVTLYAMRDYIKAGGRSRGSALYSDAVGELPLQELPEIFRYRVDDGALAAEIQEISFHNGECEAAWRPVRPVPCEDSFFENVWRNYRENNNIY